MAKGVANDARKDAFLLHAAGIEVQGFYETLSYPGPSVEFEEATDFEKTVHTLNAYSSSKLSEPYERHVVSSMAQHEGKTVSQLIAGLKKQARDCIFTTGHCHH